MIIHRLGYSWIDHFWIDFLGQFITGLVVSKLHSDQITVKLCKFILKNANVNFISFEQDDVRNIRGRPPPLHHPVHPPHHCHPHQHLGRVRHHCGQEAPYHP
jgi:hypothetical protein